MDMKKFGTFIASVRKENNMTQMDLAEKLQVTDKAVSKWERGLGFPDINTLEPLADALGLSVLELMRSEKIAEAEINSDAADSALTDTFELAKQEQKNYRKKLRLVYDIGSAIILGILLWISIKYYDTIPLPFWGIIALMEFPRLIATRNRFQGSAEDRRKFRKIVLRSLVLSIGIMVCVIVITVIYAINRN